MRIFDNIHEAYLSVLKEVRDEPEYKVAPRGQPVREITDFSFRIRNPKSEPVITKDAKRNETIVRYTADECDLYDSCSNDVEDFAKASSFWRKIANPDGTVNSAYGYLIWKNKSFGSKYETADIHFDKYNDASDVTIKEPVMRTPWEWAKESLLKDKDTRQAFLKFSLPEHQWMGNKDQTCTMHANFLIREDKLHLTVVMRSNDVVLGLAYDMPWFISLMERMVDELKEAYPSLSVGSYTHTAHSFHLYERNLEMVNRMLGD